MLGLPAKDRFTHERIDGLFANPLRADPGAQYVKQLYLNLSTRKYRKQVDVLTFLVLL